MAEGPASPLVPPAAGMSMIPEGWTPTPDGISPYVESMILSASGWRAVFAADGEELSGTGAVRSEHIVLVGLAARVLAETLRDRHIHDVIVGQDTRPTGSMLTLAAIRVFLRESIDPEFLFAVASPEIMSYTRKRGEPAGFFYVSASHNPIGHNGLKMGLENGSVIGGTDSARMIARFRDLAADAEALLRSAHSIAHAPDGEEEVLARAPQFKRCSLSGYRELSEEVIRGPGPDAPNRYSRFLSELGRRAPGIVADQNGSARAVSIDARLLTDAGCRFVAIHDTPGAIAHQILPEGKGLEECMKLLDTEHRGDPRFVLGYVPDNDGDRGNLVAVDGDTVRQLEAQEVFALSCIGEFSWLAHTGALSEAEATGQAAAIVVNGPTSMRIDRIAALFGVEVHRAEVGEANVVERARELRGDGYLVRILGEGSNGGNITHPQAVRDPIQTVFALLKVLFSPGDGDTSAPLRSWLDLSGNDVNTDGDIAPGAELPALLRSLPRFTTTSTSDPRAVMKVSDPDHNALKSEVESMWERRWPDLGSVRDALGVTGYRYENYEGTVCRPGRGNRTGAGRGGLKILLDDAGGVSRAFLWMRGSGTEPVFRVMVDVEGDQPELERELLSLLREIVSEADTGNCHGAWG